MHRSWRRKKTEERRGKERNKKREPVKEKKKVKGKIFNVQDKGEAKKK